MFIDVGTALESSGLTSTISSLWSTDHFPLRGYTITRKHPPESGLCDGLGSTCVSAPCIPAFATVITNQAHFRSRQTAASGSAQQTTVVSMKVCSCTWHGSLLPFQ